MKISDLSKVSTKSELHAIPPGFWRKIYVARSYIVMNRFKTLIILAVLFLSSLSEGIGVMSLILVLKIVTHDVGNMDSQIGVETKFSEFVNRYEIFDDLGLMLLIVVGAIFMKAIFEMAGKTYTAKIQADLVAEGKLNLLREISKARWTYFISYKLGRFVTALNQEAASGPGIYNASLHFVAGLFTLIVYLSISLFLSWMLTVAIIACSIAIVALLSGFVRLSERLSYQSAKLNRSIAGRLADGLSGIKSIKSMGLTEHLIPLIRKEIRSLMRTQFLDSVASNGLRYSRDPIVAIVAGIGLYFAVTRNMADSSVIIGIVVLFHRANSGVSLLQGLYQLLAKFEGKFFSYQELLLSAKENAEESEFSVNPIKFKGNIELEQVYFRYTGGKHTVLDDVSLICPHGSITALIGPSGAGKTTILDMLCCLYRPTRGRILVDGHDLSEFGLKLWRNCVGYVEQDSLLFHDTVAANVSLRDPSLGQDDVELALESAGAMPFVSKLPMKLDTVLGERGVLLSGGERQRITIARALIRNPKVLLLDEATTALDPQTEKAVVETLQELKDDVTIIAVSHQARIAEVADCVYRLENGKIERV